MATPRSDFELVDVSPGTGSGQQPLSFDMDTDPATGGEHGVHHGAGPTGVPSTSPSVLTSDVLVAQALAVQSVHNHQSSPKTASAKVQIPLGPVNGMRMQSIIRAMNDQLAAQGEAIAQLTTKNASSHAQSPEVQDLRTAVHNMS